MRRNKNHVPRDRALWRRAIFCYVTICELYAGSRSVETVIGSTNRCNFRIQFKIAAIGFLFCFLFLAASGCSTFNALEKRSFVNDSQSVQLSGQQVEVQRGRPRPIIDAAGRFSGFQTGSRLVLTKSTTIPFLKRPKWRSSIIWSKTG